MTPNQVVKHFGSQSEAARKIGRTRAAVSYWVKLKRIPFAVQCQIERQTAGALKATPA